MIYDNWKKENNFGEKNGLPSLTEPMRCISVEEYLRDPSLILRTRSSHGEIELERTGIPEIDERLLDEIPYPDDDLNDSYEHEVPRDPDLYAPKDTRRPRTNKAKDKGASAPERGASAPAKEPAKPATQAEEASA